jgi:hypothetical protein
LGNTSGKNWHHPFPKARFKNKLPITLHEAYNKLFFGCLTAWEAEKFLREILADKDGFIRPELIEKKILGVLRNSRVILNSQRNTGSQDNKKKESGKKLTFRQAFEIVFGKARSVEQCVKILKNPPWMPPGVSYRWEGDKVILIFDYNQMRIAAKTRKDVDGLLPKDNLLVF